MKHLLPLVVFVCITSLGYADFASYNNQVDYFEVVGNQPGNLHDDFNDGVIAPWSVTEGTAYEANGYMTLTTPGYVSGPIEIDGASWMSERSDVVSGDGFDVFGGQGNFTATSRWATGAPGENSFYGITLSTWTISTSTDITFNLNVYNLDSYYADAIGIPSGLGIWFLMHNETTDDMTFQTFALESSVFTDDVLLQLMFDDSADQFTAAFSTDGGATLFENEFTPFSFDLEVDDVDWYLESEQWIPEPATLSLLALGGLLLRKRK